MTTILTTVPLYPLVTPQDISWAGLAPVYSAAPSGLSWWNPGGTLLHVKNGGGASTVVTVPRHGSFTDLTFTIGAGAERFIGPFPRHDSNPISQANDADPRNAGIPRDGRAGLHTDYSNASFSVTSGVTYALLSLSLVGALYRDPNLGLGDVGPVAGGTTALVQQTLDPLAAIAPSYSAAAASGNHLSYSGGTRGVSTSPRDFIHVKNTSGSPVTITAKGQGFWWDKDAQVTVYGPLESFPLGAGIVMVPAGGERMFTLPDLGKWASSVFSNAPTRYTVLSYSATAGVTVGYFCAGFVSTGGALG